MERVHVVSFNAETLPVELDGVSYLVDARQYGRTTVPALREQRDTSGEAGENALDTSGAWTRSQTDWSYGAVKRILIWLTVIVAGSTLLWVLMSGRKAKPHFSPSPKQGPTPRHSRRVT